MSALLGLFLFGGCAGKVETNEPSETDDAAAHSETDTGARAIPEAGRDDATDSQPNVTVTADAAVTDDAGDACLAACRATFPSGSSASALILYSCGTGCGPSGECGTKNLFGVSASCTSCMVTSPTTSCIDGRAQCKEDNACSDFLLCAAKCT